MGIFDKLFGRVNGSGFIESVPIIATRMQELFEEHICSPSDLNRARAEYAATAITFCTLVAMGQMGLHYWEDEKMNNHMDRWTKEAIDKLCASGWIQNRGQFMGCLVRQLAELGQQYQAVELLIWEQRAKVAIPIFTILSYTFSQAYGIEFSSSWPKNAVEQEASSDHIEASILRLQPEATKTLVACAQAIQKQFG